MSDKALKIAVASGKGGTGKTTVTLGLASLYEHDVTLIDCDVEEPNVHLFTLKSKDRGINCQLKDPEWEISDFSVDIPSFNEELCNGCGICKSSCFFNAITIIGNSPLFFPELCHYCGACFNQCPRGAITVSKRTIGKIRKWKCGKTTFIDGQLNIGEAKSPPLIKHIKKGVNPNSLTFIDSPPGTSCPFVSAVNNADYVVLVSEPTPFGLNDLSLAVEALEKLNLKFGVIINKCDSKDNIITDYCLNKNIKLLGEIPLKKEIAEIYSQGKIPALELPELKNIYEKILRNIINEASK